MRPWLEVPSQKSGEELHIGPFRVLEKLGEGGMGVVYKAIDTRLDRTVALKRLNASLEGLRNSKARLLHEAQAASNVEHPSICTVYDIISEGDQIYLVTEYLRGITLRKWFAGIGDPGEGCDVVDEPRVIKVITKVTEGLDAAHAKGILHRDIKPENIMVSEEENVKIMDFGLAKLGIDSSVTDIGTTAGTLAYMSPEQVRGERVDQRTDIYALGVVLYEALSGQLPFDADHSAALMYAKLNLEPKPLTSVRPKTDPVLNQIVMKCIQCEREKRYRKMAELRSDLLAFLRGKVAADGPFIEGERERKNVIRSRLSLRAGTKQVRWLQILGTMILVGGIAVGSVSLVAKLMRPAGPSLILASQPSGAMVMMDGKVLGTTPMVVGDIKPGIREMTFSKPSYQQRETSFAVASHGEHGIKMVLYPLGESSQEGMRQQGSIVDASMADQAAKTPTASKETGSTIDKKYDDSRPKNTPRSSSKPISGVENRGALRVDIWTNKGSDHLVFYEGDTMRVYVRVNRTCYLRVVYHSADGTRYLLTGAGDRQIPEEEVTTPILVNELRCVPPFGVEKVQAIVRNVPFGFTQTETVDGLAVIRENLAGPISSTRGMMSLEAKASEHEKTISFSTSPR